MRCLGGCPRIGFLDCFNSSTVRCPWSSHRWHTAHGWDLLLQCALLSAWCLLPISRMLPKLIEQPDLVPSFRRSVSWPAAADTTQGAVFLFGARTLLRSRQHRLVVSLYVGVGGAAVLAYTRIVLGEGPVLHG